MAGDNPYCIQISGEVGYEEARSIENLSIFRMRAATGNHHAVLVLRTEATTKHFHWSYWKGEFVQGTVGPPAVYCTLRKSFLAVIKRSPLPKPDSFKFSIYSLNFSVPFSFRPTVTWYGATSGITFFASAPSFVPLQKPPEYNEAVSASDSLSHVEVNFGETRYFAEQLTKTAVAYKVEGAGNEFGLKKEFMWYLPSSTTTVQYSAKNKRGDVITLIHCSSGKTGLCLHTFYKDGWTYTFRHQEAEMPEWESMQNKLVAVTNSFITRNQDAK